MTIFEKKPPPSIAVRMLGRFLFICLLMVILMGAVVLFFYQREKTNEMIVHKRDAMHIVQLQHRTISRQFESIESDLLYLSEEERLQDFLSGRATTPEDVARNYAVYSTQKSIYDQIRYMDEDGQEIVRVNSVDGVAIIVSSSQMQSKALRYYFTETKDLERGEVYVSAFDLNVEHGEIERPITPTIRFATPVFDADGRARGALVLNYLGKNVIDDLNRAATNSPGRLLLLNPDRSWIQGPWPEDAWGSPFGHDRGIDAEYPGAAAATRRSTEGQLIEDGALFTFKTVSCPDATQGSREVFTIVSRVPEEQLHTSSRGMLRRHLFLCLIGALPIAIVVWIMARTSIEHQLAEENLKESEARLRALSLRLATNQEDDRRRISRDLHDDLGQLVTAIILDLQRSAQTRDGIVKQEMIERGLRNTEQVLERVRAISSELRPRVLDDLGLQDAVESLLVDFEAGTGIEVRAALVFGHHDIPLMVSESVYRIMQESLTNVCKHAQVMQVSVTLRISDDRVTLMISDEGVGIRPGAVEIETLGMVGMRERTELLRGTFEVQSEPGDGTVIHVSIPIDSDDPVRSQRVHR